MHVVHTKLGSLSGKVDVASNGREYFTFHRIPYAQPPVGILRFKAPKPAKPWTGILDATIEGDECYSIHEWRQTPVGSEDCLTLNVFTPTICNSDEKRPVMIWIHGGGFQVGSSKVEYVGPQYFMSEDIVFVSFNYRLGIFGFLSLRDKSLGVPGNAGLKDQVMALRWVQEHIGAFGGDAANVTVFGESAGAGSIGALLCSPMGEGLFHKVIMQSGSALNPWMSGQFNPEELATYFHVEGASEKVVLDVLMQASKEELLNAAYSCKDSHVVSHLRPFAPVVEGPNPYEQSFLPVDQEHVMQSGRYIKVPTILGYNSLEGIIFNLFSEQHPGCAVLDDFYDAIAPKYGLAHGSDLAKMVARRIQDFYFGKKDPRKTANRKSFFEIHTDTFFLRDIYRTWQFMVASNPNPVYVYRFAMEGELNILKKLSSVADEGVCHADEAYYMFQTSMSPKVRADSPEDKTIKRFVRFWANFAKTSDPNGTANGEPCEVNWLPTNGKTLIHFGHSLKMIVFPESHRMAFWDEIDKMIAEHSTV